MENHQNNPKTIHDCAQSGDIIELQKLLQDNPSLLNERNAIMSETPLHISASKSMIEIVKFLLEWKGNDKVVLESKNMYGETPLHLAAKNGSNEAVRLLLVHGAYVDAENVFGMTALHLSVLYSTQTKDCSVTKTLLENNADPNAIDDNEETPLHLAAKNGGNEVALILLTHGVTVDSQNQKGKTPLHLAAKNGRHEVARLLLTHGAFVDSETERGKTPLHLAAKKGSNDIAELLLAHGAFVDSKTQGGMTPLDYLSNLPESEKLRELLLSHQEEQRKRKALEAGSKVKEKMDALEKELSKIVGLDELKMQLRKWAKGMLLDERRKLLGVKVGTGRLPHMAFLGNPGTGKTMVARLLGKLLHGAGVLRTGTVTEVQRTDLVGEYIGQTGLKTRKKIQQAKGGILFVDEAYRLIPYDRCGRDFGLEALEEIMSIMDSGEVLVIFAGYDGPMQRVIASNEGFCRRVTNIFKFKDLSCEELANVLHIKMNNQTEGNLLYGFKLHSSCSIDAIAELIGRETTKGQRMKMNGGLVDIMLNNAKGNLDLRLSDYCEEIDELMTIKLEDFEASIRLLPQ